MDFVMEKDKCQNHSQNVICPLQSASCYTVFIGQSVMGPHRFSQFTGSPVMNTLLIN